MSAPPVATPTEPVVEEMLGDWVKKEYPNATPKSRATLNENGKIEFVPTEPVQTETKS